MKGSAFVYSSLSVLNTSAFNNTITAATSIANVAIGGNQVKCQSDSTDANPPAELTMNRSEQNHY